MIRVLQIIGSLNRGGAETFLVKMSYQEGQWHLIRALKKVKEIFLNIRLLILGEGNYTVI